MSFFQDARERFHAALIEESVLRLNSDGVASNADSSSRPSKIIARGIYDMLETETREARDRLVGQTSGRRFEHICAAYIDECFSQIQHLRPGIWDVRSEGQRNIAWFEQYSHLIALSKAAKQDPALAAALQGDYTITPDIVLVRGPEADSTINANAILVNGTVAKHASLRKANGGEDLLHASISCKWTIRSDRVQNTRAEALNLIRNRKGRLPHIVAVTGEPLPSRIGAIALGTGDIDCVYHFALNELIEAVNQTDYEDAAEALKIMVDGKRLKDISDLPLDLAI